MAPVVNASISACRAVVAGPSMPLEGKRVRAVDFLDVHVNCGHGSLRSIAGFECPGTDVDRTLDAELVTDDLSASRSTRALRCEPSALHNKSLAARRCPRSV